MLDGTVPFHKKTVYPAAQCLQFTSIGFPLCPSPTCHKIRLSIYFLKYNNTGSAFWSLLVLLVCLFRLSPGLRSSFRDASKATLEGQFGHNAGPEILL